MTLAAGGPENEPGINHIAVFQRDALRANCVDAEAAVERYLPSHPLQQVVVQPREALEKPWARLDEVQSQPFVVAKASEDFPQHFHSLDAASDDRDRAVARQCREASEGMVDTLAVGH